MRGLITVVALSGGKDSTAMALRMAEIWPELDPTYPNELCGNCGQRRGDHSMLTERCPSRAAHVFHWHAEDTFTPRPPVQEPPHWQDD